ncbi:hypothetical protein OROGR_019278 [Orobanche gracilis]
MCGNITFKDVKKGKRYICPQCLCGKCIGIYEKDHFVVLGGGFMQYLETLRDSKDTSLLIFYYGNKNCAPGLKKFWIRHCMEVVTLPFFVLHGEADTVTDPEVSRALYERASSSDKTIKLYPGMWHGLTAGEPDDNIDIVFSDIISWLDKHAVGEDTCIINTTNRSTLTNGLTTMASLHDTVNSPEKKPFGKRPLARYICGFNGGGL